MTTEICEEVETVEEIATNTRNENSELELIWPEDYENYLGDGIYLHLR